MNSEGREPRGFRPRDVMNETERRFSSDAFEARLRRAVYE